MRRSLSIAAFAALLLLAAIPAWATQTPTEGNDSGPTGSAGEAGEEESENAQEPAVRFALAGEARGLELAIGDQGVTLGAAISRADSTPTALGLGAGQCDLLGDKNQNPSDPPCAAATTEKSRAPGEGGNAGESCASPPLPAPLDSVLELTLACGSSESGVKAELPTTINAGRIGTIAAQLNLAGINQELEDTKDQIVSGLEEIIGNLPPEAQTLFDEIFAALDEGEAVRINLGPTTSDVIPDGDTLEVVSTAKGAEIGVLGIPDLDQRGNPIPDTANALEDGLVTIEIGDALSRATLNTDAATADAEADAALVRVKVLDITKAQPSYEVIEVAPGETQTILQGTPLESTIVAADSQIEEEAGSALASSDAISLHLLKGVEGGLRLALARTTAGVSVAQETEPNSLKPRQPTEPLPATGGTDYPVLLLVLGVALAGGLFVTRKLVRR